jgi:hypothetical protein
MMTKQEIKSEVEKMIVASSCCPELKAEGEAYLKAVGTSGERAAAESLIREMKEDVTSIDDLIAFVGSEEGKQVFGVDGAAKMTEAATAAKSHGEKYCICPACTAGGKLLDHEADLLK